MNGSGPTIEHVVIRRGRAYRVQVPISVTDEGEEAVEAFVALEVQRQDQVAAQAEAGAPPAKQAPAELTAPEEE